MSSFVQRVHHVESPARWACCITIDRENDVRGEAARARTVLREPNFRPEPWFCPCRLTTSTPAGRVGHEPRAALLSGACPPRHAATARPHRPHPSVHMAPAQPASAHQPQPCAHGVGRVTWSGAGMREPHHPHPSRDGSQIGGPVPRPSLTLTPPSAGLSAFDGKAG